MSNSGDYKDQPFLAEIYDYIPSYSGRKDKEFYLHYCRGVRGEIIELGCGTGRILIPAAEAGKKMTGIDSSEYMLARCKKKLQTKQKDIIKNVELKKADITDFDLNKKFELAIIPFHAFQHIISIGGQLACLKCINEHLDRGGKLIFDVFQVKLDRIDNPELKKEIKIEEDFKLPDGRLVARSHRIADFHRAEQYNDVEMIFDITDTEGRTERFVQTFPFRYFFRYELEQLLARCNFEIIDLFGDFDKSPLRSDSPEVIFVAKKI